MQVIQLTLFGGDETYNVRSVEKRQLSSIASSIVEECRDQDDWGIEKTLRLTREYIRREIRSFFGVYQYDKLIVEIRKYNGHRNTKDENAKEQG